MWTFKAANVALVVLATFCMFVFFKTSANIAQYCNFEVAEPTSVVSANDGVETKFSRGEERTKLVCPKLNKLREDFRICLLQRLTYLRFDEVWGGLHSAWERCVDKTAIFNDERLSLIPLVNEDDIKIVLQPKQYFEKNELSAQRCVAVTLGIGGDIQAEEKMKIINPFCRFFGADPIVKYGQIYTRVGKYFRVAVGAASGVLNASVKFNDGLADYKTQAVRTVELPKFLTTYVNESVIDHLWMDNEGPEYQLLPLMTRGGILDKNDITICQLNVEIHHRPQDYNSTFHQFGVMMLDFISNSDFALFHVNGGMGHQRLFFVNVYNTYCVERYLSFLCR